MGYPVDGQGHGSQVGEFPMPALKQLVHITLRLSRYALNV